MNTIPDEAMLALWLDDELNGEEFAKVEAWAAAQPEQLAAREEVRSFRRMISGAIPREEEPPFPDFFNSRISKAIRDQVPAAAPVADSGKSGSFLRWLFPITAFAGMAFAFWVGTKTHSGASSSGPSMASNGDKGSVPVWYTPEVGVDAEWVKNPGGSSSVIILQGVNAIPDATDFTQTVFYQDPSNIKSTAETEIPAEGKIAR